MIGLKPINLKIQAKHDIVRYIISDVDIILCTRYSKFRVKNMAIPIEPNIAVKTAYEYLLKVSPNASKFTNFRVEEISNDKQGDYLLTLSYEVVGEFGFDKTKEYKDFKVTKEGTVESMKIRKV